MNDKVKTSSAMTRQNEEDPYEAMNRLDIEEAIAAQEGKTLGKMIYNIPHRDGSGKAPSECKYAGCPRKGQPHTHVIGVGIAGINQCVKIMGGMDMQTVGVPQIVRTQGLDYWHSIATTYDMFVGNRVTRVSRLLIDKNTAKHGFEIVQTFAIRNSTKMLIDQNAIARLEEMGRAGRNTFNDDDAETVFGPMIRERAVQQKLYFQHAMELGAGQFQRMSLPAISLQSPVPDKRAVDAAKPVNTAPPSDEEPPPNVDAAPHQEDAPKPKSSAKSDFPGSDPQRKACWAILKRECNATDDQAHEFVSQCLTTRPLVSQFIGDAQKKDFTMWNDWAKE